MILNFNINVVTFVLAENGTANRQKFLILGCTMLAYILSISTHFVGLNTSKTNLLA